MRLSCKFTAAVLAGAGLAITAAWTPLLAQTAKTGGHLAVAMALETSSLDPINGNAPGTDRNVYNLFAENLLYQDSDGEFQPALATNWEWSEDLKSITFTLREGVTFHDGTPFDAEAVKFNFDRVMDPDVNARARQYVVDMESTEVLDSMTVRVNLKQPSGSFLAVLANEAGTIVSPTAVKERGAEFARNPVGTGPFVVTEWSGGVVKTERYDNYWGADDAGRQLPYLDRVSVRAIPNTAVKLVELQSGNVQLVDAIQVKDYEQIQSQENLELIPTIPGITQYITFNNGGEKLGENLALRKALTHAIDRSAIEGVISRGEGVVQTAFEPPNSLVWSEELGGHSYDPELAKKELDTSGFEGSITLSVIQRDPDVQISQMLQAMWRAIGLDVRIEVIERTAFVEQVLNCDYDVALLRNVGPLPDPDMTFASFFGRNAAQDFACIANEGIWDQVDEARAQTEMEARRPIYVDIQQEILDNYWQAYLFWRPTSDAATTDLKGFDREFNGAWRYHTMWLDD